MSAKRVLIVDDEAGVRALMSDQLSRLGFEVSVASHGDEAVERFNEVEPDLVILDFLVPGRNGFGIAEAIRSTHIGSNVPIVMMSGVFKNPKTAVEARQKYQVVEFLSKPLKDGELEAVVQRVLGMGTPRFADGENQAGAGSEAPTPPPEVAPVQIVDGVYMGRPFPRLREQGELIPTPVAQILSILRYEQATGMVDLTSDGTHRRVYIIEGQPSFMQSNAERENVGSLLLSRGRITEIDLERCRSLMRERRRTLQQSLLDLRLVSESELATAYKLLAGELLPVAIGMSAGQYRWRQTDAFVGRVPEKRFDALQIVFKGIARHVHPPQIFGFFQGREDFPIYRTRLSSELGQSYRAAFSVASGLEQKLHCCETFRDISRATDLDAATVLPALFALVSSGMAVPVDSGEAPMEVAVRDAVRPGAEFEAPAFDLSFEGDTPEGREYMAEIEDAYEDLMSRNFFEIFSATTDTDAAVIKQRYFELAKKWHMDAFANQNLGASREKLAEIFGRITEAYETISDPERRSEYLLFLDRKRKGLPTDVSEILRGEQLYDQALAMIRRKDFVGAQEVLEEATRLNPDPIYYASLGWVRFSLDPHDDGAVIEAVNLIRKAVREQENLPQAYVYLGNISFRRQQYGEARRWWYRCLKWEPGNSEASRGVRAAAQKMKEQSKQAGFMERLRGKKS